MQLLGLAAAQHIVGGQFTALASGLVLEVVAHGGTDMLHLAGAGDLGALGAAELVSSSALLPSLLVCFLFGSLLRNRGLRVGRGLSLRLLLGRETSRLRA